MICRIKERLSVYENLNPDTSDGERTFQGSDKGDRGSLSSRTEEAPSSKMTKRQVNFHEVQEDPGRVEITFDPPGQVNRKFLRSEERNAILYQ